MEYFVVFLTAKSSAFAVFLWHYLLRLQILEKEVYQYSTRARKLVNESKGFGFIAQEDGPDVFAHYSSIEAQGFKTLTEGNVVNFDVVEGNKGPTS